jgi:biotin carboxyl carrier protein
VDFDGQSYTFSLLEEDVHFLELEIAGQVEKVALFVDPRGVYVHCAQGNFFFERAQTQKRRSGGSHSPDELVAPMPGKILKVMVAHGEAVNQGDTLMILEAMKMEHPIRAPQGGEVKVIHFKAGDRVAQGEELLELK